MTVNSYRVQSICESEKFAIRVPFIDFHSDIHFSRMIAYGSTHVLGYTLNHVFVRMYTPQPAEDDRSEMRHIGATYNVGKSWWGLRHFQLGFQLFNVNSESVGVRVVKLA